MNEFGIASRQVGICKFRGRRRRRLTKFSRWTRTADTLKEIDNRRTRRRYFIVISGWSPRTRLRGVISHSLEESE